MGQYYKIINLDKEQYLHPHKFGDGLKLLEFGCSGYGTMAALTLLLSRGNGLAINEFPHDPLIGSWAGDRIVVSGDYADKARFTKTNSTDNLYSVAKEFKDASEDILVVLARSQKFQNIFKESLYGTYLSEAAEHAIFGTNQPQEQDAVLGNAVNSPRPFDLIMGGKKNPSCWRILNLDKSQNINSSDFGEATQEEILAQTGAGTTTALAVLLSDGNGRGNGDLHSSKEVIGSWAGDRIVICSSLLEDKAFSSTKLKNVANDIILALAEDIYILQDLQRNLPSRKRKLLPTL